MANRNEFSSKTRKAALIRSGKRCEAEGTWYGLQTGMRCTEDLSLGVQYDHFILDANSKDNSVENCRAVCPQCHKHKTRFIDVPTAAKTVAQSLMGMKTRAKVKIASAPKQPKPKRDQLAMPGRVNIFTREAIR